MKTPKSRIKKDGPKVALTRFGKYVDGTTGKVQSEEYWRGLYELFLNTSFRLPVTFENDDEKNGAMHPVVSVHKNGRKNLIIFERKNRADRWHKMSTRKIDGKVFVAHYATGYHLITGLPVSLLKEYDLHIDYGKDNLLVMRSEDALMLRSHSGKL